MRVWLLFLVLVENQHTTKDFDEVNAVQGSNLYSTNASFFLSYGRYCYCYKDYVDIVLSKQ